MNADEMRQYKDAQARMSRLYLAQGAAYEEYKKEAQDNLWLMEQYDRGFIDQDPIMDESRPWHERGLAALEVAGRPATEYYSMLAFHDPYRQ